MRVLAYVQGSVHTWVSMWNGAHFAFAIVRACGQLVEDSVLPWYY